MLVIRLQRTGRKGHAMFRIVVQDSRRSPSSGKVIDYLGSYDPHQKTAKVDKDKVERFLKHGAQPSGRVVTILKSESIKLPSWVETTKSIKKKTVRNPEKRRSTAPKDQQKPTEQTDEAVASEVEVKANEEVSEKEEKTTEEEPKANDQPSEKPEAKPEDNPTETEKAPEDNPKEA